MKRPALYLVLVSSTACIASGQAFCSSGPSSTDTRIVQGTPTPTPSPTPITDRGGVTPSPTPGEPCTPQAKPYVCLPGFPTLEPIVAAAQSRVPWQPEAVYVALLVAEINKDPRVCAIGGFPLPSDEISVKYRTNSSSENFDVVHSSGNTQLIPAGPTTPNGPANVCTPAKF